MPWQGMAWRRRGATQRGQGMKGWHVMARHDTVCGSGSLGAQCRVGAGGRVAAAQEWAARGEAEAGARL